MKRLVAQMRSIWQKILPPRPDRIEIQREMRREDPSFNYVQRVQGELIDAITAKGMLEGEAIRREREFWQHIADKRDA